MDGLFLLAVAGFAGLLYVWLRDRGDRVGWLLGIGHAALALLAIAASSAAVDTGFAVSMGILAVYAGAMSAAEVIRRIRSVRTSA